MKKFSRIFILAWFIVIFLDTVEAQEEKDVRINYSHPSYPYCKMLHPESRIGEKFIGNFTKEEFEAFVDTTKRRGKIALDVNRIPIRSKQEPKTYPVFVKKEKHEQVAILCPPA